MSNAVYVDTLAFFGGPGRLLFTFILVLWWGVGYEKG